MGLSYAGVINIGIFLICLGMNIPIAGISLSSALGPQLPAICPAALWAVVDILAKHKKDPTEF